MTPGETQEDGSRKETVKLSACAKTLEFGTFLRHCTSFTRCSAAGVATRLELRGFLGPLVSDTGAGERWRRRRESVPGVGPLAN